MLVCYTPTLVTLKPIIDINTVIIKPVYNSFVLVEEITEAVVDVKSLMAENIEQVLERGEKLDSLELQAEELSLSAKEFKKTVSESYIIYYF